MGEIPYREGYSRSKAAATKALELDEALPEAHSALAQVALALDWDWARAESGFQRAIDLNPNSADAHGGYGYYLLMIGRRPKEGIEHVKRGLALDPLSTPRHVSLFFAYYLDRQYDLALGKAREVSEFDANPQVPGFLALIHREKGIYEEAIAEFLEAADPRNNLGHLGNAYARAGKLSEARIAFDRYASE